MSARWLAWLRALCAAVLLAAAVLAHAPAAHANDDDDDDDEDAPADTTLHDFLDGLADSTDRYFGLSAAQPDTAGLDSALALALANPQRLHSPVRFGFYPDFRFNRVDGPVYGGGFTARRTRRSAQLGGELGYAVGGDDWRWRATHRNTWRVRSTYWTLRLEGGRMTGLLDRERSESNLATARALISGRDRRHYLRREGVRAGLEVGTPFWRLGAAYRDHVETPLATTTTWNLLRRDLSVVENFPATAGRAREVELSGAWRLPWAPVTLEAEHQTSGRAIASDFEYRRTSVSASGKFGLGRFATLVPQTAYGRTSGRLVPQAAHYLGGSHTLRSVAGSALGGAGAALARLDLIGAQDLLALARIPHPDMLPIQGALFVASGAVWGADAYGGPSRRGVDWPDRALWMSEAGASIIYQPGLPDPTGFVRLSYAVPIGPDREQSSRWSVSYTRALDLVRPFGEAP